MNVIHVDLRLTEWICRVVSLALFHHLKGCVCCFRVLFEKKRGIVDRFLRLRLKDVQTRRY